MVWLVNIIYRISYVETLSGLSQVITRESLIRSLDTNANRQVAGKYSILIACFKYRLVDFSSVRAEGTYTGNNDVFI